MSLNDYDENPYASPAEIEYDPRERYPSDLEELQVRMNAVRRGLGCMLGSVLLVPVSVVSMFFLVYLAPSIFVHLVPVVLLSWLTVPVLQLMGYMFCSRCPDNVVWRGRDWIWGSLGLYAAAFFLWIPATILVKNAAGENMMGYVFLMCLGGSALIWQFFLVKLAYGLKSQGLAVLAVMTMVVYFAGGAAIVISSILGSEKVIWLGMVWICGILYMVLYPLTLFGLQRRIARAVWEMKEWDDD